MTKQTKWDQDQAKQTGFKDPFRIWKIRKINVFFISQCACCFISFIPLFNQIMYKLLCNDQYSSQNMVCMWSVFSQFWVSLTLRQGWKMLGCQKKISHFFGPFNKKIGSRGNVKHLQMSWNFAWHLVLIYEMGLGGEVIEIQTFVFFGHYIYSHFLNYLDRLRLQCCLICIFKRGSRFRYCWKLSTWIWFPIWICFWPKNCNLFKENWPYFAKKNILNLWTLLTAGH